MPATPIKRRLIALLRNPRALSGVSPVEWNALVPVLRRERLLAHLGAVAKAASVFGGLPGTLQDLCESALIRVKHTRRSCLYIAEELTRRLSHQDISVVLLKGAAYAAADHPFARGRMFSDLDILVRRKDLEKVESVLVQDGWALDPMDVADERYYREWMHELPPFKHPSVAFELDIHHNLTPPVSRIQLDMASFWQNALTAEKTGLVVLSPPHQLIHSATHLFFNDELRGGLRELLDIDGLCRMNAGVPDFWRTAIATATTQPALTRTLFYALDTAQRLLDTPVDAEALKVLRPPFPSATHLNLMRWLFDRSLLEEGAVTTGIAKQWLFIRSHWVRMPPHLLIPHLVRKWSLKIGQSIKRP